MSKEWHESQNTACTVRILTNKNVYSMYTIIQELHYGENVEGGRAGIMKRVGKEKEEDNRGETLSL